MKLIIDIPKKTFEDLRQSVFITVGETFAKRLIKYIKNGTPLESPCDLCRYNPPSSTDGKPCSMCPAERR